MNKIKLFIASMLGAIALVFACVLGTRVNAAATTLYDATTDTAGNKYTKATTINTTATDTFDFQSIGIDAEVTTVSSKNYLFYGTSTGTDGKKGFQIQNKSAKSYTITFKVLATDSGKNAKAGSTFTFNGVNVTSASTAVDVSAVLPASSTGMLYVGSSRRILLENVKYEETQVTTYSVTYMDGSTKLKEDATVVSGASISYTPKKYGYDFEGWYTDSNLTAASKIDTTTYTVTSDATLYANWTAWTNTGIEEYTITNAAIEKIATGVDGSLTKDLELAPSMYTAMKSVSMTSTKVTLPNASEETQAPCFSTNGAVTNEQCGLKFTAPANGTITAYMGAGGGSQRNIKLTDGTNTIAPTTGSTVVGNIESARYTPVEIVYTVEKDTTYYLGGDNGVRIYYVSFEAATTPIADVAKLSFDAQYDKANATAATKLRFIGTIEGLATTEYTKIESITFTFDFNGTTDRKCAVTQLYLSIITDDNKYEAADNKMYFVYQLDGIRNYSDNQKLTNCKLTVVFTDGSSKTETHADIELPTFA